MVCTSDSPGHANVVLDERERSVGYAVSGGPFAYGSACARCSGTCEHSANSARTTSLIDSTANSGARTGAAAGDAVQHWPRQLQQLCSCGVGKSVATLPICNDHATVGVAAGAVVAWSIVPTDGSACVTMVAAWCA